MKKLENRMISLGMIGVVAYLIHTITGNILWKEYNPIVMDISSLTAVGAPNRSVLMIFTTIYGICMILFATGMSLQSLKSQNKLISTGWIVYLIMQLVSFFGYALFPLEGDKTEMTFGNTMHIVVTMIVVFTTIATGFLLAFGYMKEEKTKHIGRFTLIMAIIITISGALNPIGMGNNWNILGLTERCCIYSLQVMSFVYSFYFTKRVV